MAGGGTHPGAGVRLLRQPPRAPVRAEAFLTRYVHDLANATVERYWRLGDELWTRFNLLF